MALNKVRIGSFIREYKRRCDIAGLTANEVSGINRDKEFFEPSVSVGEDTGNYKVVPPEYFACNLMHVGRDAVLPVAMNTTEKDKYVSPAYTVFYVADESLVLREFFFIFLKSQEKDRFFWFHTDSSVRDGMTFDVFCNTVISVPPVEIQKKYVAVYDNLMKKAAALQSNLDDLKTVCDATVEQLRKKYPCERLGPYIRYINERNTDGANTNFQGIDNNGNFIKPRRISVDPYSLKIVRQGQLVFNHAMECVTDRFSFAYREGEACVVSNSYQVFESADEEILLNKYILLWTSRSEFARYAKFISYGTAHENFEYSDLENVAFPIPPVEIQKKIVGISEIRKKRIKHIEKLKKLINDVCPVLVRGAEEEGKNG